MAGKDGIALAELIHESQQAGTDFLAALVRDALRRYSGQGELFTHAELDTLAESIAAVRATAELMGRARVREQAENIGLSTFGDAPLSRFLPASGNILATPEAAVAYFLSLTPTLGMDPQRFIDEQRRRAFTIAVSTSEVLTSKVQQAIAEGLRQNRSTADVTRAISETLDTAGVGSRNPQYAEMVFRTNTADAFQTGMYEEAQLPDLAELFPVWEYLIVDDHRTGEDHRPKGGKFYPRDATFADVRGDRPYNCRCSLRWVDAQEWADLQRKGKRVEKTW